MNIRPGLKKYFSDPMLLRMKRSSLNKPNGTALESQFMKPTIFSYNNVKSEILNSP